MGKGCKKAALIIICIEALTAYVSDSGIMAANHGQGSLSVVINEVMASDTSTMTGLNFSVRASITLIQAACI